MDPQRFREVYERVKALDESATYKVRPKRHSFHRATQEELEDHAKVMAHYVIELREIVQELMEAIAAKAGSPPPKG